MALIYSLSSVNIVFAASPEPFPYKDVTTPDTSIVQEDLASQIKSAAVYKDGPVRKLIAAFLPNRPTGETALSYIQYVLNIALSLVAFIALLVLIYGFYGIIFRGSEEGIAQARKTVSGAVFAILIM
jgi:hypothetical protein